MRNHFLQVKFFWISLVFMGTWSCVDLEFDAPPPGGFDPNLPVNITIAELKARHTLGQFEMITDEVTFSGIVISSDEAGNFYKQLVVSDTTGGIEIRIDVSELHNLYPVGRKVYIRAKGLWLGDYNGLIQLGAGVDAGSLLRIPEPLVDQFLIPATYGNPVTPATHTIGQLTPSDVSTLVRLENVQFVTADAGRIWADVVLGEPLNRELEDCHKQRLIIRTSDFARFASDLTPEGNGMVTGVLGRYNDDFQLMLRDENDVEMNGPRCSGNLISIDSIRTLFLSGTSSVPNAQIRGVVISDRTSQSVVGLNLYLQDSTGGIVLRFDADHSFDVGDELLVDVSAGTLEEYNGLLQVSGLGLSSANIDGHPGDVLPREATVIEILNNAQLWESTLVLLHEVTLGGNSVFNNEVTVTDATGSMILYTRSTATFASTPLPVGAVNLTAIISEFNIPQLIIRNPADAGITAGSDINESFNTVGEDEEAMLPGWVNIAVKGTRLWRGKTFSGNHYVQATAFGDTQSEMEAWLITPEISLDEPKKLSFESAKAFFTHDGLSVWVSSDFNGIDVGSATWSQLHPVLAQSSDPDHVFIPSGSIDLSTFSGNIRIGFKYVGSGPAGQTTSFRLDNIKVEKL